MRQIMNTGSVSYTNRCVKQQKMVGEVRYCKDPKICEEILCNSISQLYFDLNKTTPCKYIWFCICMHNL